MMEESDGMMIRTGGSPVFGFVWTTVGGGVTIVGVITFGLRDIIFSPL